MVVPHTRAWLTAAVVVSVLAGSLIPPASGLGDGGNRAAQQVVSAQDAGDPITDDLDHTPDEWSSVDPAGLLGTPGHVVALSSAEVAGAHYVPGSNVLELPAGDWLYLPDDADEPVVAPPDHPAALAQIEESQTWLAAGDVPGAPGATREMARRALLDLQLLLQDNGAVAAAWHTIWKYSWPRDSAFTAAGFAATGHLDEAYRILQFTAGTQREDGTWEARTLLDGSGPPDNRAWQLDANGWVPWATWQYLQAAAAPRQEEAITELYPMIRAAADHAADSLDENGLPPARPDYWEGAASMPNLGTVAPLLAGLRAAAAIAEMAEQGEDAERWFAAADRLQRGIEMSFGSIGYQRTVSDWSGQDAAVAFLAPPFTPADRAPWQAIGQSWDALLQPTGGVQPGEAWQDDMTWTPATMFFALAWANGGQQDRAESVVAWLAEHRTEIGALPEKVAPDGQPAAVAPLGWTAALTTLTLVSLDEPLPVPPTGPAGADGSAQDGPALSSAGAPVTVGVVLAGLLLVAGTAASGRRRSFRTPR